MAEADDLTTMSPENSSFTTSDGLEIADFECNICFELAQDPVITLCGHLHCWPCLYRWLKLHSHSHECPVCKTRIEDEKLIPLYGRGKTTTDPRLSRPEIPHRPAGQRPETAPTPPPEANNLTDTVLGRIGGVIPIAPAAFSVRFHEFSDAIGYGGSWGFQHGYTGSFGEDGLNRESSLVAQGINDDNLKKILVFILLFVLFDFLTF